MSLVLAAGPAGDTIFAPATGMARSAISVLRMSGPATSRVVADLAGGVPRPRLASLRQLRTGAGQVLDKALVLWMPAPASYTGEDCAELHLHGGRAVLEAVTGALVHAGLRPADPGEFTFRAHLNGKLDLLEAEAVGQLADAETEAQRVHALRQLTGEQSAVMARWSRELTEVLAWQEALIDFADESLPEATVSQLDTRLRALASEMQAQLAGAERSERLRRGLVFVLVGAPNVGKSSLLNRLAEQDAAIVSPSPGTTRDPISVDIELDGIPVTLIDTAGIRDCADGIEIEGIRRALARAQAADLVVEVLEAGGSGVLIAEASIRVFNKCDLAGAPTGSVAVSALTGAGCSALRRILAEEARRLAHPGGAVLTNARHAAALRDASGALAAALNETRPELRAEELRTALNAVGRITGVVATDDLLGVIFGAFCIGK